MPIKKKDKRSDSSNNPLVTIQDLGMFSMTNNFDNRMEILEFHTLIKRVMSDLNLYVRIVEKRAFGYAIFLYRNSPVRTYMIPEEVDKLEGSVKLNPIFTKTGRLSAKAEYIQDKEEQEIE